MHFFNTSLVTIKRNFLSLAYGYKKCLAVLDKFDTIEVFMFSFKKHTFINIVLTLMLVYRKQSLGIQELSQTMQYLLATNSIDIMAGDFDYDLLKVTENKLLDIFTDPVRMCGSMIDHVYIKKMVEGFSADVAVENAYVTDHHAARIIIEKNTVDFHTIPYKPIRSRNKENKRFSRFFSNFSQDGCPRDK